MFKFTTYTFLLLFFFVPLSGQDLSRKSIGELRLLLQHSKPDSNRVVILHVLSRYYLGQLFSDRKNCLMDTTVQWLEEAIRLSDSLHLGDMQENGQLMKAEAYISWGNLAEGEKLFFEIAAHERAQGSIQKEARAWLWLALELMEQGMDMDHIPDFYNRAITLYRLEHDVEGEARALTNLGNHLFLVKKYDAAERELQQALGVLQQAGHKRLSNVYYLLSVISRYRGAYDKSLLYVTKCVDLAWRNGDTSDIDLFNGELALVYDELGRAEESSQWYRKILYERIAAKVDRGIVFRTAGFLVRQLIKMQQSREALGLMDSLVRAGPPQTAFEKAIVEQNFAYCYDGLGQYAMAEKHLLAMTVYFKDFPSDEEQLSLGYRNIGRFYLQRRQYKQASFYLDTAAVYGSEDRLIDQRELYKMLFVADSALGNFAAAVKDLQRYEFMNDSLYNDRKSRQIEELTIQYKTEKKEQSIQLLENEKRLQQHELAKEVNTKRWIIGVVFLLVIITGLLINYSRLKQRTNRALQVQQQQIEKKNVSLQHLVTEKDWLVKEIHHRVKNNFHMVMGLLHTQAAYLQGEEAIQAITESRQRIQAMSLIHQKLYQSESMSAINMSDYIHELVDCLKDSFETGRAIQFNLQVEPVMLQVSHCIPLGLILNEAVTNAIKHAFPDGREGVIDIVLKTNGPGCFQLCIWDNGIGIPAGYARHMGMKLMQGLSEDIDAFFRVECNHGTTVLLEFNI